MVCETFKSLDQVVARCSVTDVYVMDPQRLLQNRMHHVRVGVVR